ncbi:MAG: TonB-dependent receptor [Acidobacteria bacterium]|nr:TonB-dependent receptor [Acidobacteriota bacterium]
MAHARSYAPSRSPFILPLIVIGCLLWLPAAALAQTPLRGRVVDATGAPIARVPVALIGANNTTIATTLTDAAGAFVFDRACAGCRARAALTGFAAAGTPIASGVEATLTLAPAPVRESVVVTATRDAAPTSQIGASVTVFDAAALERRGDALVGDILRQAPGAAVVQNGGQGNVTSLFVRGGENSYTKVLLDGIPLNEPGGTFNFGGLSAGHLDRIEFVRGAQSALFGSDAMAGVVHLVTARSRAGTNGRHRPAVSAEFGGGGYDTMRGSATVSGGTARWDYSLHGGRYQTDNRAANNAFDATTFSLSAGGALTEAVTLRVVGRYEDGRTGTPGQTAFGRADLDAFFTQSHLVGGATVEHQITPALKQRLTYALATSEQRSTNLQFDAPYTPSYQGRTSPFEFYDFTYDTGSKFRRHQAGYQADLRLTHAGTLAGAEFLTLALEWDGERGTLIDHLARASTSPGRDNAGLTLQHQHVSRWVALTTGVRVEHNDAFGTAVMPRVSAAVFLRTGSGLLGATTLKANAGRGVKEPTLRQSFSLSPFDLGNPDLKAERSRALDAGIKQRLFQDRVSLEATWFDNRFDEQISTRTISFSPYQAQYFNVGLTRARGAELIAEIAPTDDLRLSGSYTFTDSEIVAASSEFSDVLAAGRGALRRPRHTGQVQAVWSRGPWSMDIAGTFQGERSDSDFSALVPALTAADGYALWRAQAQLRVTPHTMAYVRVENLTDVDYMEPLGYPAWRRTVHAGLRLRF